MPAGSPGEPAAEAAGALIGAGDGVLTPLGVAEVVDRLVRIMGVSGDDAVLDVAQLGLADPQPLTATVCLRAGLLRARRSLTASVATSDPHLLGLCRVGIGFMALPDSRGHTWSP